MNVKNRGRAGTAVNVISGAAAGPEPEAADTGIAQAEAAVGPGIEAGTGPRAGA